MGGGKAPFSVRLHRAVLGLTPALATRKIEVSRRPWASGNKQLGVDRYRAMMDNEGVPGPDVDFNGE